MPARRALRRRVIRPVGKRATPWASCPHSRYAAGPAQRRGDHRRAGHAGRPPGKSTTVQLAKEVGAKALECVAHRLEDPARPRRRPVGDAQHALRKDEVAGAPQHLHPSLDPAAQRHRCQEVGGQVHRQQITVQAGLHVRAQQDRHVGQRHHHAAVTHVAGIAVPLLHQEPRDELTVVGDPPIQRTAQLDERIGGQMQGPEAFGNLAHRGSVTAAAQQRPAAAADGPISAAAAQPGCRGPADARS